MIGAMREWLVGIIMASILVSVADTLLPEGGVKKIAGFTGGLALLFALLSPVLHIIPGDFSLHLESYADQISTLEEEFRNSRTNELETGIAEATEAYISDKAEKLGLSCFVTIQTELTAEGVPIPVAVELSCSPSEPLASYMETELGIARSRQTWKGT